MADKKQLDTADLFALADALQIELSISNGDQIDGKTTEHIEAQALGLRYPMHLQVVSSRVEWGPSGKALDKALLISIAGNLAMIALHEAIEKRVHIGLIDVSKLKNISRKKDTHPLTELFERFKGDKLYVIIDKILDEGIVAHFERGDYQSEWTTGSSLLGKKEEAPA